MSHSNLNDTPLGLSDIVAGIIIFVGLWWIASTIAGPEGFSFLKNLLNEQRSFELLFSGLLFLGVWLVLGKMVVVPYLDAFYEREAKTSGAVSASQELKKEISNLKADLEKELHIARVEGVKRRNDRALEAKKNAEAILEAEGRVLEEELCKMQAQLDTQREEVLASLDKEVDGLSSSFYQRLTSIGSQTIH